jgi:hypothetical protein
MFSNHMVASLLVGGQPVLFDPSYGRTWSSLHDVDDKGMDFYGMYNPDGGYWVLRKNEIGFTSDLRRSMKPGGQNYFGEGF